MLFHSQPFILVFLPLCLTGLALVGRWFGAAWALAWLVGASLLFHAWGNQAHTLLMLGSIAGNHAIGRRIHGLAQVGQATRARRWFRIGLAGNLLLLVWFKYADFLRGIVAPGLPALEIALPLAISFFTFQQIMFLADCRDPSAPLPRLLPYTAFVAFFPHLIAGPLVRPRAIVPQLARTNLSRLTAANLEAGMILFLLGLGKKLVLADMFGGFADTGFAAAEHGATLTLLEAWAATLSYALQIYFDFSAYSDMATGLARMVGVHFPLNFDSPYQARTITDFWRRWHITLGLFLREHVYIPLGGNRAGLARQLAALLLTMLLAGLWHGAGWRFVLWGGMHGVMLAGHLLYRRRAGPMPGRMAQTLTLFGVVLAWVPFRAPDLPAAWAMTRGLLGLNGCAIPAMIVSAFPPLRHIASAVPVLPALGDARTLALPEVLSCLLLGWLIVLVMPHAQALSERAKAIALTAGFALTVQALFFAPEVAPFLYFRF